MSDKMDRIEITKALRSMDKPDMAYGYDGAYRWKSERIGQDAANYIDHLTTELSQYRQMEVDPVPLINICPKCNRIMAYNSYFGRMTCRQCGYAEDKPNKREG